MNTVFKLFGTACMSVAFMSLGLLATSCEDDITIHSVDTDDFNNVDGVYGFVKSEAGASQLMPIALFGTNQATGHVFFELSKAADADVNVQFRLDEKALAAYNEVNNTSYAFYPTDKLVLANEGKTVVKAGEKKTASVELTILPGGSVGQTYAVALSAVVDDPVAMSANSLSYIYLVKPMAEVPDATKGEARMFCFVEVNDENILNMGEYTMKGSGKPFFDVVSIFAANINIDGETGRAHVQCNDQVSFVLKNADKLIRPLQAKGIKVNMTILGNWDEAGMGNLSPEAAADFAKELKAYVDIYGLDGIDFDDEYTKYNNNNPSPGFLPRSRENYGRLVYECRRLMPDKLIGIYEYKEEDAPNGTFDGQTVGDLIDYMFFGTYQTYVKGRESHTTGLTKAKYCPYSLKINEEYLGGWGNFNPSVVQDMKDAGYRWHMFYNPKPRKYAYDYYFSVSSKIWFNDEVAWSGVYYNRTEDTPNQAERSTYDYYLGNWKGTSQTSLFLYIDEENKPRWWDWGGAQPMNVRFEENVPGESYHVYGFGSYPELAEKYPLVVNFNKTTGLLELPIPQVIHQGSTAEDTWQVRWGTFKGLEWIFPEGSNYEFGLNGFLFVDGQLLFPGVGGDANNNYGIDPCHEVDGKLVAPDENVKYHLTGGYTLVKQ